MELEAQAHGRLELEDADTANTTAVRDRLTRLQIERGVITKADATALRKVAWPHILQQHCTCEDDGLCEYLRAKFRGLGQNRSPENLCFRVILSVPAFVLGSLGNITSP